ncbi:CLOCK-interacting pacemaker [Hoplias malabaricus]|uniref:CLOCK-interacting pacemaker n=1 Tax=Hoplias malabaricus TaxID=27720 RepID=UPI003462A792
MPLDSGFVGERPARPASKNDKDKCNSAALLASRSRALSQQESGRESRCSSEKDSGYSDTGSDSLQTDAEDQRSVSELKQHKASGVLSPSDQGNHIFVSPELTPIFIIKNVVVKQPGESGQDHVLQSSLGWGSGGASSQTHTHLYLLQPTNLGATPVHLLKPQTRRAENAPSKKGKNTYLPILNSYPRIAPHPSKKNPEKLLASRGHTTDEHILSKRICTEEKREEVSTSTHTPEKHLRKQLENRQFRRSDAFLTPQKRRSPPTLNLGSPSVSSSEMTSPPSAFESRSLSDNKGLQKHHLSSGPVSLDCRGLQKHPSGLESNSKHAPVSDSDSRGLQKYTSSLGLAPAVSREFQKPTSSSGPDSATSRRLQRQAPGLGSGSRRLQKHDPIPDYNSKGLQKNSSGPDSDSTPAEGALPTSAKHRRFLNTVEILSQSGLLDITLRTQELLRQSIATEQDITELRQHAQLLCQVAEAGEQAPTAWAQLHQAMVQCGYYPSLNGLVLEPRQNGDEGQQEVDPRSDNPATFSYVVSGIIGGEEIAPPSPLFAPMPSPSGTQGSATSPEHGRGNIVSANIPVEIPMPPDSSTHGGLL